MLDVTIPYVVRRSANKFPEKVAIVTGEQRLTYRELASNVKSLASGLRGLGLSKGDKIGIILPNSSELLESIVASMELGLVANPLNFRLTSNELAYIIRHSQAKAIVCSQEFLPRIEAIDPADRADLKNIIVVGHSASSSHISYRTLLRSDSGIADAPGWEPALETDDTLLLYTSGTTGKPKGVVLTQHGVIWTIVTMVMEFDYNVHDCGLFLTPIFHISALTRALTMFFVGGTIVNVSEFEPEVMLQLVEQERATYAFMVPAMFTMLEEYIEAHGLRYDTSSFTKYVSGAGQFPPAKQASLKRIFPNAGFYNTYGSTELCSSILINKPAEGMDYGSCGVQCANLEVRVVDENLLELPYGTVGELAVRGPTLMRCYLRDEAATAEVLRGDWLLTGDLGWRDEQGSFYLAGRSKDMIKSGGENVYPKEVEDVLLSHPQIKEAAVVGVPDELWGEAVKAVVVLREEGGLNEYQLEQFCREHLAGYKKPKYIEFRRDLPKNVSGKVIKDALTKQQ